MKMTKREAARRAYVTSQGTPGRYFLIVLDCPQLEPFAMLHDMEFPTMRAAQAIANGIRVYLNGSKA